ncbi:hypothetical protein QZH41_012357, partial [Actinostola sp. cb2023]
LLQTFSRPSPDLLQTFSRPSPDLLQTFSRPSPDLLQTFSRPSPDLLQTFSRPSQTFSRPSPDLLQIDVTHFRTQSSSVVQVNDRGALEILEHATKYFELGDCFLATQNYEELQVGSVSEDVPIFQLFRQAHEDPGADVTDDGKLKDFDVSFECDFNLCFKDIIAEEIIQHKSSSNLESKNMSLQLQVIPSSLPGQAQLVVPPNVDCSAVPGLSHLCVQDDHGMQLLSSELLVNEMYSLLTITTAIMNVVKCQNQASNSELCDENESVYATSPQYVGQAGPAVHIVTCIDIIEGETTDRRRADHLFLTEDVSISVPCRKWPSCARQWSLRTKACGWPSRELIDQVFQGGCHLVPKYDPSGGNDAATSEGAACSDATPKTQWRYSFSLAEKVLMKSITDDQKMCYLIFKYLFARFVKLESVITTYTAKTLFLWELETVPADQWCFSMIGDRVKNLVEKLRSCVENKYCQHYFIDGCNTLQQMDDRSRRVTLDNGFAMLDEEMAEGPNWETGIFETTLDFPIQFMTTFKTFYPINVWLEAFNFQMKSKLDPPNEVPSEQDIQDFLDNTKVQPIQMPEILIHLALADKVYGKPLPVPQSLLQQQKVTQVVEFLKRSTTAAKFEECMKDLDVELKFLHLQLKTFSRPSLDLLPISPELLETFSIRSSDLLFAFSRLSPDLLQTFSRPSPDLLQTFFRPSPDLLQTFSRPSPDLLQTFSRLSPDLLQTLSRPSPDPLQTFSRPSPDLLQTFSRPSADLPRSSSDVTHFRTQSSSSYEPLQVGSMSEDVPICQLFRQAHEDPDTDMTDDGKLKDFYVSFESDFNLCFKDIIAEEIIQHKSSSNLESKNMSLQLQVIPSSLPGQFQLVVPPNVDCSAVPGLSHLCVQDAQGLTLLSSELLVNEMYSLLTITTALLNVIRCQNQSTDSPKDRATKTTYSTCPQYVGQAGPAVHIVTCIDIIEGETYRRRGDHIFLTEDVSISVPCRKWPSCARQWFLRTKACGWPSRELIDQVFQGGCHLVPKYDPSGGNDAATSEGAACSDATPKTHWRYSFSLAEKVLMKSITDDQRMCYLIFKYLFARFVKLESVITTYTAKTLFLWELETVPADQWCFSMIGDRVKNLVEKLRSCVENKYCLHYFIDGCNTLQQMDDKSRRFALDNGFAMLDEEMAEGPNWETGIFETTLDFPIQFMTTFKTFHPINVWLEAFNFHMKSKLDPPNEVPSEQDIRDFLDNTKVQPIQMPEILIHLALADKFYGEPLPVPQSLLQQQKVTQVVEFLKRSTRTAAKFEECMKNLDVELKFLHLQYKIIEEIEQFLKDNPTVILVFENLLQTFSRYVRPSLDLLPTFSSPSPDLLQTYSRYSPDLLPNFSRPSPDLLQTFSRPSPDFLQTL